MQLFGGAGIFALLGWLGWVGTVGAVLVGGLRQLTGERRLLLGALGAAWTGYLTQSLVSIDMAPLLATGWLLSGAILAVAPAGRTLTRAVPRPAATALAVLTVPLLVIGLLGLSVVVRAERAGALAARGPDGERAGAMITHTLELADWEPRYPLRIARRATDLGHHERAAALYARAIEINPRYTLAYYEGARTLIQLGRIDEAAVYWDQVVALAPQTVQALDEAAGFFLSIGAQPRADEIAGQAAAVRALGG